MSGRPWVVMRSKNDVELIGTTLEALRRQTVPVRILNIDSGSTDGTLDVIRRFTDRLVRIAPEDYVPGRVLNLGMEETDGEIVIFLNSDTTPQDEFFVERILEGFEDERQAASYGRQMPRPDCRALFARDTDRAFGDGVEASRWLHFFSMAASAIRRSAWESRPFDPEIRYSEDVEWTWWAKGAGWTVRYAPEARAMHSHNYTLSQSFRRHRGEGDADARIFGAAGWRESFPCYVLGAAMLEVLRDWRWCIREGRWAAMAHSLVLRPVQRLGRWVGHRAAREELEAAGRTAGVRSRSVDAPKGAGPDVSSGGAVSRDGLLFRVEVGA